MRGSAPGHGQRFRFSSGHAKRIFSLSLGVLGRLDHRGCCSTHSTLQVRGRQDAGCGGRATQPPQIATASQRPSVRAVFARSDAGVTKQSGEAGRHGVGERPTRRPTGNGASPAPDCHSLAQGESSQRQRRAHLLLVRLAHHERGRLPAPLALSLRGATQERRSNLGRWRGTVSGSIPRAGQRATPPPLPQIATASS